MNINKTLEDLISRDDDLKKKFMRIIIQQQQYFLTIYENIKYLLYE